MKSSHAGQNTLSSWQNVNEWSFNNPLDTQQVMLETSLPKQSTSLVETTIHISQEQVQEHRTKLLTRG